MRIGEIQKNAVDKIVVSNDEFSGHKYTNVRIYVENGGEWVPTKKGVTVPPDKVGQLIQLLQEAQTKHERGD